MNHWTEKPELGSRAAYGLTFFLCKALPLPFIRLICLVVSFFYYVAAADVRRESRRYLEHVASALPTAQGKQKLSVYKHIASFSLALAERIEGWAGRIGAGKLSFHGEDIKELVAGLEAGQGALLITSHLGNVELLRGLADYNATGLPQALDVTAIVDYGISAGFNAMVTRINPDFNLRLVSTDSIGIGTGEELLERIAAGGLVVIAGDRTSSETGKVFRLPFLGREAPFPQGPFMLAGLLHAPVYYTFGLRDKVLSLKTRYGMFVYRSKAVFSGSRKQRQAQCLELARDYSAHLEELCKKEPYQWYNFYDFWGEDTNSKEKERKPE